MDHPTNGNQPPGALLSRAKAGDQATLGELLDRYRNYLLLIARLQIGHVLRVKMDASDFVQETLLDAYRHFDEFQGTSEPELVCWLRRILVRNLTDEIRRFRAAKRDVRRQKSLEALLDRSSLTVHRALAAGLSTPSAQREKREQAVLLADVLEGLPEDYREVIVLRHLERLRFEDIAARLGRTSGAVRKLWARALARVRVEMERKE